MDGRGRWGVGGRKQKLDPSGVPFTQRGGKRQKKADLRAQEVESGAKVPLEQWSEAKRSAYQRLQSLAARRKELSALEKQGREDFRIADGESEAGASRGSGDPDYVEVDLSEEGFESTGVYSALSSGASGVYTAFVVRRLRGVEAGRRRLISPKVSRKDPRN